MKRFCVAVLSCLFAAIGARGQDVALKTATGDFTMYVSTAGNDSNDGLGPGTAKLTIPAAFTTLFSGGRVRGSVIVAAGNYKLASATLKVGSTVLGTNAALILMPGVVLTTGVNSPSVDAIQLSGGSSLLCPRGGSTGGTSVGAQIRGVGQAATIVRTMVAADAQNGTVESITVDGCWFSNFTAARGGIDISATANNTRISNNIVSSYTGSASIPGILMSSGTGATGALGSALIDNNWILPGTAGTAAIVINGVDPQGLGSAPIWGVTLLHNMVDSLLSPTVPFVTITGNAASGVSSLRMIANWFNPSGAGVPNNYKTVDVVTCHSCTFDSNFFEYPNVTATGIAEVYLEATVPGHILDFENRNPGLEAINANNVSSVIDATVSPTVKQPAYAYYKQISSPTAQRAYQIGPFSVTSTGIALAGATSGTSTLQAPATGGVTSTLPSVAGTLVTTIASGTQALNTVPIPGRSCATTITLTSNARILATDKVSFTEQGTAPATGYQILRIDTQINAGHAFITVCNPGAESVTPGAMTVNWSVTR